MPEPLPASFTKHQGCLPDPPADEKPHLPLKCAEGFVSNLSPFQNDRHFFLLWWLAFGFCFFFFLKRSDGGEGLSTARKPCICD